MIRSRLMVRLLAGLALGTWMVAAASAQQESAVKVGQRVLIKNPASKLKGDNPQVVIKVRSAVLKIDKIQGANLLVRCIGAEGWIARNEVVLVDDAITYFTNQLKLNPRNSYALTMRGVARRDRHDDDGALKDFDAALKLNKNDAGALSNRGVVWMDRKDYDKAAADFNRAILLDPKDAITLSNRARLWIEKGDVDKAFADCKKAIELDPKYAVPYLSRAQAWAKKGEPDKAIADLNDAI